ncbi:hypothetical protein OJAV_G00194790 [Oryzias javanicus]|uniref:Uncharacterized protein n=1 Tax=Oryzias javanicus TaxID=123683 RepID=A0A3S2NYZ3_ORYJA|nr:hypothetical protein OJAV_G00194790 [Oryzias javanicus]
MLFSELLVIIIASVSCITFCLVATVLLLVFCRKDPHCCKQRLSSTAANTFPGGLFIIGRPDDYQLDSRLPQPPSYNSVCRTDRQSHIHAAIAQRFGLSESHQEPPPAYEETFDCYFPAADVQHLDVRLSIHTLQRPCTTSRGVSPRLPLSL